MQKSRSSESSRLRNRTADSAGGVEHFYGKGHPGRTLVADHQKCTAFRADLNSKRCADLFDTRDSPLAAGPDALTERSGSNRNKSIFCLKQQPETSGLIGILVGRFPLCSSRPVSLM